MSDAKVIALITSVVATIPVWIGANVAGYNSVNRDQLRKLELTASVRLIQAQCKQDKSCLQMKLMQLSIGF
jgi:hypothetical protein